MQKSEVLKEIFDKNIVEVIKVFAGNTQQHFSLSQVAYLSGVKTATSLRILNKLVERDFIKIDIMGKTKYYKWSASPKTDIFTAFLQQSNL